MHDLLAVSDMRTACFCLVDVGPFVHSYTIASNKFTGRRIECAWQCLPRPNGFAMQKEIFLCPVCVNAGGGGFC